MDGQLSCQSGTPSPSESVSVTPQPHTPGAVLFGSFGQPSVQSITPSPSVSRGVQRAQREDETPPMVVKLPPTIRSDPRVANAETPLLAPMPTGNHSAACHLAMLLTLTPPALVNIPPTKRSPLKLANSNAPPPPVALM